MTAFGLPRGVRLVYDEARASHALLRPEGVSLLNDSAAEVVLRCDGRRDAAGIVADLVASFDGVMAAEVAALLDELAAQRVVAPGGTAAVADTAPADPAQRPDPVPFGLLAELTYRCPLRCPYCSNPVGLSSYRDELSTEDWCRVLREARELGVLQVHLSGGEPLARRDLVDIVRFARSLALYTNLVTSGVGLSPGRLDALADAGLDHVQLSIQDAAAPEADAIAGIAAHERKLAAATAVTTVGLPLSVNVVLHRHNVSRIAEIAALAESMGADRLELAHTQYYGWGLLNRAALLPTRDEVAEADAAVAALSGDVVYVRPDYLDGVPKPCMNGWGSRQLVVAPNGDVLPCPAAAVIPDLGVVSVRTAGLADIWYRSDEFQRFRGTAWMRDPCRTCPRREVDFGGCRCQAYQLTGDAAATDPACALSPDHGLVVALADGPRDSELTPRLVR